MLWHKNVFPHFEKGVKGGNLNGYNRNSYPVKYYWKGLLTRKVTTFSKGDCDTSLAKNAACQRSPVVKL